MAIKVVISQCAINLSLWQESMLARFFLSFLSSSRIQIFYAAQREKDVLLAFSRKKSLHFYCCCLLPLSYFICLPSLLQEKEKKICFATYVQCTYVLYIHCLVLLGIDRDGGEARRRRKKDADRAREIGSNWQKKER